MVDIFTEVSHCIELKNNLLQAKVDSIAASFVSSYFLPVLFLYFDYVLPNSEYDIRCQLPEVLPIITRDLGNTVIKVYCWAFIL
jgi:hypothetical protein